FHNARTRDRSPRRVHHIRLNGKRLVLSPLSRLGRGAGGEGAAGGGKGNRRLALDIRTQRPLLNHRTVVVGGIVIALVPIAPQEVERPGKMELLSVVRAVNP